MTTNKSWGVPSDSLAGFTSGTLLQLLRAAGQDSTELTDPFTQHVYVYACVRARAQAISSVPLTFWAGDGDDAPEVTRGPLVDLLKSPHPLLDSFRLWQMTSIYRDLYGEAYWLLHERQGDRIVPLSASLNSPIRTPVEIFPVPGSAVQIHTDAETGMPVVYRYQVGRRHVEYDPGAVVPFLDVSHTSPLRGVGATEALRRRLEADFHAEALDISAARNGGFPSYWLSTQDQLSEPQLDQLEARLEARQNAPNRHQKPAILHGGFKLENSGWSPRDMENLEMRTWSRDAIMAVFGVTKPILGITDDVNRANAREAKAVFWESTIIPELRRMEATLQRHLLDRVTDQRGLVCQFNTDGVDALSENLDDKIGRTKTLVDMGVPFNDAARLAEWDIDPIGVDTSAAAEVSASEQPASVEPAGQETAKPEQTLNGAQIDSLLKIIAQVATGELTKETAVRILVTAFPIDAERARELLADVAEGSMATLAEPPADAVPRRRALEDELDDVFGRWNRLANMSASALRKWSENECSRLASVDPAAVIARNLELLETPKSEWTAKHLRNAKRAISFIERMRNGEQGDPAREGCPSKRDISLKNWAHDPSKPLGRAMGPAAVERSPACRIEGESEADCIARKVPEVLAENPDMDQDQAVAIAASLCSTSCSERAEDPQYERRRIYSRQYEDVIVPHERAIERAVTPVMRDFLEAVKTKLRQVGSRELSWLKGETKAVGDQLPQEVLDALDRLLLPSLTAWQARFGGAVRPVLDAVYLDAAGRMVQELGAVGRDPQETLDAVFLSDRAVWLSEGAMTTLARDTRDTIARTMLGEGEFTVAQIGQRIEVTLEQNIAAVTEMADNLPARAQRIARTEAGAVANKARTAEMNAAGVRRHEWSSANDEHVRASHATTDGQIQAIGAPFSNGLRWPNDPLAPAGEVVNCRCVTIPVLEDLED